MGETAQASAELLPAREDVAAVDLDFAAWTGEEAPGRRRGASG